MFDDVLPKRGLDLPRLIASSRYFQWTTLVAPHEAPFLRTGVQLRLLTDIIVVINLHNLVYKPRT
jgi:uncharacterized protein HemX